MPMVCKICAHPMRAEIDRAIVEGSSLRDTARQFGVSKDSVNRHKPHVTNSLTKARQAKEMRDATALLSRVDKWVGRCEALFDKAEKAGEWGAAASAARQVRGCLELLGRLTGELKTGPQVISLSMTQIQALNIADLTVEQVGAIYDRVRAERLREMDVEQYAIAQMSDEELEAEIARLRLAESGVPESSSAPAPQVIDAERSA